LLLQQAGESEVDPEIDYGNGTDNEDDRLGVHELAAQRRHELTRDELIGVNPARVEITSRIDHVNPMVINRALQNRPYVPLPSLLLSDNLSDSISVLNNTEVILNPLSVNEDNIRQPALEKSSKYSYRLSDTRDNAPRLTEKNTVVSKISNIPSQVQQYLANWRSTRPEFVEPVGDMKHFPVGTIPPPMLDRGDVMRRVESCVPLNRLPVTQIWKGLEYHIKFISMPQMVLSGILQRITTDLRKFPYNPLNPSTSYDVNLSSSVKQWIDWTRKKSALVQSMYLFRSHILQFLKSLGDMVKYATEQYKIFHKLYTLPTPVRQGEIQGRMIIYGIDQIFAFIAGHGYDKCNWSKGLNATLFLSDHFRRQLYEEMGFYLKHKEVDIQDQYPWLVRFTENIDRDAPSQVAIYKTYVSIFPGDMPSREEVLDRHLNFPIQNE